MVFLEGFPHHHRSVSTSSLNREPEATYQHINSIMSSSTCFNAIFKGSLILTQPRAMIFGGKSLKITSSSLIPPKTGIIQWSLLKESEAAKKWKNFWTIESCCIRRCFTHLFSLKHVDLSSGQNDRIFFQNRGHMCTWKYSIWSQERYSTSKVCWYYPPKKAKSLTNKKYNKSRKTKM